MNASPEVLRVKSAFHPAAVERIGDVVVRDVGAWTPTVHALLRHLEDVGLACTRPPLRFAYPRTPSGTPGSVELAQTCWLNAKLHDATVAEREGLPPLADRAPQLRAIVDAYGLSAAQRRGFFHRIVEFAIVPWAVAWRARAAAWQLRHRDVLEHALA